MCDAQTEPDIIRVEYFFDTDPGFDNGVELIISPGYELSLEEIIDCGILTNGLHTIGIRAKDDNGIWGITQLHQFVLSNESYSSTMPDLTEIEYFVDTDNGYGTSENLTFTSDSIVSLLATVDLTGYGPGLHTLGIRSKDADDIWGITYLHQFVLSNESYSNAMPDLTEIEYFVDTDNGYGTGENITFAADSIVDLAAIIDLTAFGPGLHTLGIRSKDTDEIWGITHLHQFVLSNESYSNTMPDLNEVEYFIDTDNGYGTGENLTFTSDSIVSLLATVDLTGYGPGLHTLGIRSKDTDEIWGITHLHQFVLSNESYSNTMPDLTEIEYFVDTDNGYGTGENITFAADSIVNLAATIDLTAFGPGLHTLGIRSKDADEIWGITHLHQFVLSNESYSNTMPDLNEIEYFIDTDNGYGTGENITFTADSMVFISTSLNLNNLENGVHLLGIRAKDEDNVWGHTHFHQFCVMEQEVSNLSNLDHLEYFINEDPGFGNGTVVSFTPDLMWDTSFVANLASVVPGNHIIGVRAVNTDLEFSHTYIHEFCLAPHLLFSADISCDGTTINFTDESQNIYEPSIFWDVDSDGTDDYTGVGNFTHLYGGTGIYQATVHGYINEGCESEFSSQVIVSVGYEFPEDAEICEGENFLWRENYYNTQGSFYDSLTSVYACDSVYILNLIVHPVYEFIEDQEICSGETYTWRENEFSVEGIYYDSLQTEYSCDSVYVLNLIVHPIYEFIEDQEICSGETYTWRENEYSVEGIYYNSLQTEYSCDSVFVLNLIVHPVYEFIEDQEICSGETYTWRENEYSVEGIYYDSLQTEYSCDSVYVLNLIVHPVYEFVEDYGICSGETYTWRENEYSAEGIYYDSLLTVNSCDSVYVLNLIVHPVYEFVEDYEICSGDTYTWRENEYSAEGIYYDSLQTEYSCDSVYVLNLIVHPVYEFTEDASICQGDIYTWRGDDYTEAGTYYDNLQTVNSCDSVFVLNLSIKEVFNETVNAEICVGEAYILGSQTIFDAGEYTETFEAINGCDSVVTLNLSVFVVNVGITYEDDILSANNVNGTYQWVDCDNYYSHIEGETDRIFAPQTNGNYAVIITEGLCSDTSECQLCLGINTFVANNVKVYPNPANSELFVEISENADGQIIDALGRVIIDINLLNGVNIVNINNLTNGIYYLKIRFEDKKENTVKIIKYSD